MKSKLPLSSFQLKNFKAVKDSKTIEITSLIALQEKPEAVVLLSRPFRRRGFFNCLFKGYR